MIDSEELAIKTLIGYLQKIPNLEIVGTYLNALAAGPMMARAHVDVVFCALEMCEMDGLTLMKALTDPPLFVFLANDPSYAIEAFALGAVDYILKPVEIDRILKTINKINVIYKSTLGDFDFKGFMLIKDRSSNIIMPFSSVLFIKGDRDYLWIETTDKRYHMYKKLIDMEKSLETAKQFIRIHKSYIVNLQFAERIEGNVVKMKGGVLDIPIGKHYRVELLKKLGIIGVFK